VPNESEEDAVAQAQVGEEENPRPLLGQGAAGSAPDNQRMPI
jgi:hypothetical protein